MSLYYVVGISFINTGNTYCLARGWPLSVNIFQYQHFIYNLKYLK